MRTMLIVLAVLSLSLVAVRPAAAADMTMCEQATIQALHQCVTHAYAMGYIDNAGVAQSLLAKLDAAQAAVDRNQPAVAVHLLQAFVREVRVQAGRHIQAAPAAHMIMHAQQVIAALQP